MEKTDENFVHRGTGTEKVSLTLKRSLRVPKRFHDRNVLVIKHFYSIRTF